MQRRLNPPSPVSRIITREPSLRHGMFAAHAVMTFVMIVLLTLTLVALEAFLSGDESLSALEAADMIRQLKHFAR
jgi:hypothetical protein